jgi:hypothetical protein
VKPKKKWDTRTTAGCPVPSLTRCPQRPRQDE